MLTVALIMSGCHAGLTEIAMDLYKAAADKISQSGKLHFEQKIETSISCSKNFTYFDRMFTNLDLDDPNEYVYVSDDSELIITRLDSAWVMHQVRDNELLMFGLTKNCPDSAQWYWPHTLDPVFVQKEPLCVLEKVMLGNMLISNS